MYDATSLQEINLIRSADGFSLSNLKTTSQVNIYDISGKLVKTQNVDNATNIVYRKVLEMDFMLFEFLMLIRIAVLNIYINH